MNGPKQALDLVHLGGFPSGGTDLLWSFLNSHPQVSLAREMPGLFRVVDEFDAEIPGRRVEEFRGRLRQLDVYNALQAGDADLRDLAARARVGLAEVYYRLLAPGDGLVKGHKTPQTTENIPRLQRAFPGGRFVIITRDVRDVCLSWRQKWGKDVIACAGRWNERMAVPLRARDEFGPDKLLLLRFEDLLDEPEREARRICAFLGLSFSDNMLHHERFVERTVVGKRHFGAPIQRSNKGKFSSLPEAVLRRVEECAYPTMTRLGYQPVLATEHRPATRWEMNAGRARDAAAMLIVGNRYSSNNTLYWRWWQIAAMLRSRQPPEQHRLYWHFRPGQGDRPKLRPDQLEWFLARWNQHPSIEAEAERDAYAAESQHFYGPTPEQYTQQLKLSRELGTTQGILGAIHLVVREHERDFPSELLPVKIAEILRERQALLDRALERPPDPEVAFAYLDRQVTDALAAGDDKRSAMLLAKRRDLRLDAVQKCEAEEQQLGESKDRALLAAAADEAQLGDLALGRLDYLGTVGHLRAAAEHVPGGEEHRDTRLGYLDRAADALYRHGSEFCDTAALDAAIVAYRRLLTERPRERAPLQWVCTQANLGLVLLVLAELERRVSIAREGRAAIAAAYEFDHGASLFHHDVFYYEDRLAAADALIAALDATDEGALQTGSFPVDAARARKRTAAGGG